MRLTQKCVYWTRETHTSPVLTLTFGLPSESQTHIYVSETSLQPRTSISIDASLSTLRQPSSSQRAILVSANLPLETPLALVSPSSDSPYLLACHARSLASRAR